MDIINSFQRGRMNQDDDDRLVPNGEYREALNISVGTSDGQNIGVAQNVLGNTQVADLTSVCGGYSEAGAKVIGAIAVDEINKIYWFVSAVAFDGIYEYDRNTNTTTRVVQSLANGENALNFSSGNLVTGINYINGLLYWTDGFNPPRKINIERAKTYNIDDRKIAEDINVIVRPPLQAPLCELTEPIDEFAQNNMLEKMLKIAYRWKYVDGEWSSLSPFTTTMFHPQSLGYSFSVGNSDVVNRFSECDIFFSTGSEFVTDIQIVYTDDRALPLYVIDTLNKSKEGFGDFESHSINFKNNKIYSILPETQLTRLFDNVPLKAKAQTIIDGRLVFGGITQFFDIAETSFFYTVETLPQPVTGSYDTTIKSGRDYEVALLYLDDFGRMSTAIATTDIDFSTSVHIPYSDSQYANSIKIAIYHDAPSFATHFRIALKESKRDYYNIFPRIYYKGDDGFTYFLINDSDTDKPVVNEYVVAKTRDNIVGNGKKYKVLEVAYKTDGFLGGSEIGGLYFKIKTDLDEFTGNDVTLSSAYSEGSTATKWQLLCNKKSFRPVSNHLSNNTQFSTFYYGENDDTALTATLNSVVLNDFTSLSYSDSRYEIEVVSATEFRFRNLYGNTAYVDGVYNTAWSANILISAAQGAPYALTKNDVSIEFDALYVGIPGDKWVVNAKPSLIPFVYRFADRIRPSLYTDDMWDEYEDGWYQGAPNNAGSQPVAIFPDNDWGNSEREIKQGAEISISIEQDNAYPSSRTYVSDRDYANLEEWFFESGAYLTFPMKDYNNVDIGYKAVRFRKCINWTNDAENLNQVTLSSTGATRMFLIGYEGDEGDNLPATTLPTCTRSRIKVTFQLQQLESLVAFETDPKQSDLDIYHELPGTYKIEEGKHIVNFKYTTYREVVGGAYNGKTELIDENAEMTHIMASGTNVVVSQEDGGVGQPLIEGNQTVLAVRDSYSVVIDVDYSSLNPYTPIGGYVAEDASVEVNQNQGIGTPAVIVLNNPSNTNTFFNAFSFGNGIESNRLRDDFNEVFLKPSRRTTTVIEDYKREDKTATISWSEPFQLDTEQNRLNEFNLSLNNYKNLEIGFGSIQKLDARDTDLLVMQENKISTVLYNKNLLYDSIGGNVQVNSPLVFGTQYTITGDFGISKNPESFAKFGDSRFFTDKRRGVTLEVVGNQFIITSEEKMSDFFEDHFRDDTGFRIGGYDIHTHQYVLSHKNP